MAENFYHQRIHGIRTIGGLSRLDELYIPGKCIFHQSEISFLTRYLSEFTTWTMGFKEDHDKISEENRIPAYDYLLAKRLDCSGLQSERRPYEWKWETNKIDEEMREKKTPYVLVTTKANGLRQSYLEIITKKPDWKPGSISVQHVLKNHIFAGS